MPPKFEHKLRRHKQMFEKIATTVVLDKNENLLWSGLQRHWSCHSNGMTPLPILLTALGTVLPKSFVEAFSSNSHLNVREVWVECSPYFTALQYENNLETQRSPKATLNLGNFNFSKKSFKWFKNYLLICKVDWNVYKTTNKTVVDPDLQFREGRGGGAGASPVWKEFLFWPQFDLKIRGTWPPLGGVLGYGGCVSRVPWYII